LILIFIAAQPSVTLFLIGSFYVVSGPFNAIRHFKRKDFGQPGKAHEMKNHR